MNTSFFVTSFLGLVLQNTSNKNIIDALFHAESFEQLCLKPSFALFISEKPDDKKAVVHMRSQISYQMKTHT